MSGGDFMLDEYRDIQVIPSLLLKREIENNRLSHAYLFDANNYKNAYSFVLAFVKEILCGRENHASNDYDICKRIELNQYSEFKVIESESSIIKKEQLLELQSEFSKSSIDGNYRIYLIKDCDKMNKQASNCLLKFLEEPVSGVIAILMTNHFSKLLSTIISRCQVIHLANPILLENRSAFFNFANLSCDREDLISLFLEDDHKKDMLDSILSFLSYFEENGLDILIYMKKMWYNIFLSREDSAAGLLLMVYFYYDLLQYKFCIKNHLFYCNYLDMIEKYSNFNSIDDLLRKIEVCSYGYDMVLSNLNVNLLMDDIIIRLGGVLS